MRSSCDEAQRRGATVGAERNVPLGEAHEEVLAGTLSEAGNAEPAGLAVVLGTAVASDSVLEDLAARVGGDDLGGVGEVANDADAGDGARSRGAECAGGGRGGASCAAEEHGRHCRDVVFVFRWV